jgi:hypothetical protein
VKTWAGAGAEPLCDAWSPDDFRQIHAPDERMLGHAADPGRGLGIRRSSRHLVVRQNDQLAAEIHGPLVFEAGA